MVDRDEPIEVALRESLRTTQRKAEALQRAFPTSNKVEKLLEHEKKAWTKHLEQEREVESNKYPILEDWKEASQRYDRLQLGLEQSLERIGKGLEPDLSFTMLNPRMRWPDGIDR